MARFWEGVLAMLTPRRPEPVLCFHCRKDITGQAYQHGGLSYCAEHWYERVTNPQTARIILNHCWKLPTKDRQL